MARAQTIREEESMAAAPALSGESFSLCLPLCRSRSRCAAADLAASSVLCFSFRLQTEVPAEGSPAAELEESSGSSAPLVRFSQPIAPFFGVCCWLRSCVACCCVGFAGAVCVCACVVRSLALRCSRRRSLYSIPCAHSWWFSSSLQMLGAVFAAGGLVGLFLFIWRKHQSGDIYQQL
jgi:hypothetical protein